MNNTIIPHNKSQEELEIENLAFKMRLADYLGLDIDNFSDTFTIMDIISLLEEKKYSKDEFLIYVVNEKDSISFQKRREKLRTLFAQFDKKKEEETLPTAQAEDFSKKLTLKLEKFRISIINLVEKRGDILIYDLKGKRDNETFFIFNEKERIFLKKIKHSTLKIIHFIEMYSIQEKLYDIYIQDFKAKKQLKDKNNPNYINDKVLNMMKKKPSHRF